MKSFFTAILQKTAKALILFYQHTLSPDHGIWSLLGIGSGKKCTFYPTCSEYTKKSIDKHGCIKGTQKGLARVLRCRPNKGYSIDLP